MKDRTLLLTCVFESTFFACHAEGMVMSLFLNFGCRDESISQNTRDMYVSLSRTDTLVLVHHTLSLSLSLSLHRHSDDQRL